MGPVADALSAWSPLRIPAFRALFFAMVVSNIGMWMQMVGAQWLLIDRPDATHLIALIQTAMTLPFALFALPAGIVADNVDRRRMMIVVQSLQLFVGTLLATWVVVDAIPPYLLLLLIFLLMSRLISRATPSTPNTSTAFGHRSKHWRVARSTRCRTARSSPTSVARSKSR